MKTASIVLLLTLFVWTPLAQAAPKDASSRSSQVQVNGIVDTVMDKLWAQDDEYWHSGDYPRIIALDRIMAQAEPHFIECYNAGAWLMWSDGLDDDAQAFYQQCVVNNPSDSSAYYDYGMFLLNHRKEYPAAIRVFRQDIAHTGGDLLDWRMLAHSYEKNGDWDRAVQTWRQIKTRWPHGIPKDPTSAAVDDNNLKRALSHLKTPTPPAPEGKPATL
jgi:tetratricopeptide (TPR) repeat protein